MSLPLHMVFMNPTAVKMILQDLPPKWQWGVNWPSESHLEPIGPTFSPQAANGFCGGKTCQNNDTKSWSCWSDKKKNMFQDEKDRFKSRGLGSLGRVLREHVSLKSTMQPDVTYMLHNKPQEYSQPLRMLHGTTAMANNLGLDPIKIIKVAALVQFPLSYSLYVWKSELFWSKFQDSDETKTTDVKTNNLRLSWKEPQVAQRRTA